MGLEKKSQQLATNQLTAKRLITKISGQYGYNNAYGLKDTWKKRTGYDYRDSSRYQTSNRRLSFMVVVTISWRKNVIVS